MKDIKGNTGSLKQVNVFLSTPSIVDGKTSQNRQIQPFAGNYSQKDRRVVVNRLIDALKTL